MPTFIAMSQLSRSYQLVLAGVLVLALAWFVLIHDHHSEPNPSGTTTHAPVAPAVKASSKSPVRPAPAHARSRAPSAPAVKAQALTPMQSAVEKELAQGKLVLVLFWNPGSSVDQAVHKEVQAAARRLGSSVALHVARAHEVGSFGSVTNTAPVTQTPTILIINRQRQVASVLGYADAYGIEQKVAEARGETPNSKSAASAGPQ